MSISPIKTIEYACCKEQRTHLFLLNPVSKHLASNLAHSKHLIDICGINESTAEEISEKTDRRRQ